MFEFIAGFFTAFLVIGTWQFFALSCLLSYYMLKSAWDYDEEMPFTCIFGTISFALVAYVVLFKTLPLTLTGVVASVVSYLFIGLVWSMYQWHRHVKKAIFTYNDDIKDLERQGKINTRDKDAYSFENRKFRLDDKIDPSENKEGIYRWITFWPGSLVMFFLRDVLAWIITKLQKAFSGVYTSITASHRKAIYIPKE